MHLGAIVHLVLTATLISTAAGNPPEQALPRPIESDSIESFFQVADDVFSGGEPKGEPAFAQLRQVGVKTVISVDGARPDLASAKQNDIRYIHLPTSYGRWSRTNQLQLLAAASDALKAGPVFVHCHHGKHRGPIAIALICQGTGNWTKQDASAWLAIAGTGTNYVGLFETVKTFSKPSPSELRAAGTRFPESVKPSGMVEFMTQIDVTLDNIEQLISTTDRDHAHLQSESLLLLESLRELQRLPDTQDKNEDFRALLAESLDASEKFNEKTRASLPSLDAPLKQLRQSCRRCHELHRDSD